MHLTILRNIALKDTLRQSVTGVKECMDRVMYVGICVLTRLREETPGAFLM